MHGSIGNLVELLNKCINGGKYRGISRAYGIPYRRFTYRGIPFIPVYRATLQLGTLNFLNKTLFYTILMFKVSKQLFQNCERDVRTISLSKTRLLTSKNRQLCQAMHVCHWAMMRPEHLTVVYPADK
jgi:hypothetical protein